MKTSLTEMKAEKDLTEEQAQAILDLLARKAGYDKAVVTHVYDNFMDEHVMKLHLESDSRKILSRSGHSDFDNFYFYVKKYSSKHREILKTMLGKSRHGNVYVVMENDYVARKDDGMAFMKDSVVFMKERTSFEELLVQLDLEV